MKMIKQMKVIAALCMAATSLAQAAVVEKPVVLPEAMLTVAVSDLHGFIDGVGSVAAQVSPMMNGMMLKSMLGSQLGDPGLSGIAPGKGLAVVALDQDNVFAVIEVGEAQLAAYTNALSSNGMQTRYVDGLLIAGPTAEQVAKAAGMAQAVKGTLLAKRSPALRIAMQSAALIEKNNDQIEGSLLMMPMMMAMGMPQTPGTDPKAMQNLTRILEGEIRVLLSLAKQCESLELVLTPNNGSLRISKTLSAKAGTRLAALLNAPKVNEPNPKIQAGMLGDAAIAIDANLANPEALTTFFVAEVEQLAKEMNLQLSDYSGLLDNMKKWMGIYKGSFCETVDFGGEGGFGVNYALEIKDEASALALFKTMKEDMAPFTKLYADLGMPMSIDFKENARDYKGTKIHQFKVAMSLEQMAEEQRAPLATMNLTNMVYDVAIVDGVMLYAVGGTKVETLIDRMKDKAFKAAPLKARAIYPAGGFYYGDLDVAKYMAFVASMMPQEPSNPMPQISAMLAGSEPITSAGFREGGAVMWSVNIPGSLIGKVGQAVMMQQMQQMNGAPQD